VKSSVTYSIPIKPAFQGVGSVPAGAVQCNDKVNSRNYVMGYQTRYKNAKFSNQKVEVDGKSFLNCEFENCMILLETGETELSGCRFKNCQLLLRGNAYTIGKIINLFSRKGPMKVVDFQEPLFEKDSSDRHETKNGEEERDDQDQNHGPL
jgi:hypothetical protein